MREHEEAVNRDLLFLMMDRQPRFFERLLRRWLWCMKS